jgi:hypothetical protein
MALAGDVGITAVSQTSPAHLQTAIVYYVSGLRIPHGCLYSFQVTSLTARNVLVNATFGSLASDPNNNFLIGCRFVTYFYMLTVLAECSLHDDVK